MERKKKPVGQAVESTFTPEASIVDALQPTQQEIPAPAAEAPAEVANPYLELLRKRQKDASDEATFTAVASGLGALFSGDASGPVTEYGVSQIGNRIKRKEALEDQEQNYLLAQMKAKGNALSSPKHQQFTYTDDKGTVRRGVFVGGKYIKSPDDPVAGFAAKMGEDQFGASYLINPAMAGQKTKIFDLPKGALEKKPEEFLQSQLKDFNKRKRELEDSVFSMRDSLSKLGTGDFQNKSAVMSLVKQIESRLSDYDRTYYSNLVTSFRSLRERIEQIKTAELPPRLIEEVKATLESGLKNKPMFYEAMRNEWVNQTSAHPGIPREIAFQRTGGFTDTGVLPKARTTGRTAPSKEQTEKTIDEGLDALKGITDKALDKFLGGKKLPSEKDLDGLSLEQLKKLYNSL